MRGLGLPSATALVVANMIGTGVFTAGGLLLRDLGTRGLVLAAWVVGGGIAMLGATCYGALARRIPESGGEYVFLARTLHPAAAYVSGWISMLVGFAAPLAAVAIAFGEYTRPMVGGGPSVPALATVLLLAVAAPHLTSLAGGARAHTVAVVVELAIIAAFLGTGLPRLPPLVPDAAGPPGGIGAFAVSLIWVSFSYAGWNAAAYLGGEVKDPARNLPRAMLLGTAIVMVVYVALNTVFVFAVPAAQLAGQIDVGRLAARALGGAPFEVAATILIALALATCASAMTMAGPQVYARMAADGYLPRALATAPGRAPRRAAALQLGIALVLVWTVAYEGLLTYIGMTLALNTAATVAGLVRLRLRQGAAVTVPGWPLVPGAFLAFVLATVGFSAVERPVAGVISLATVALGLGAYRLHRRP